MLIHNELPPLDKLSKPRNLSLNVYLFFSSTKGGRWVLLQESIGISPMQNSGPQEQVIIFDCTHFGLSNLSLPHGNCCYNNETIKPKDCPTHSVLSAIAFNWIFELTLDALPALLIPTTLLAKLLKNRKVVLWKMEKFGMASSPWCFDLQRDIHGQIEKFDFQAPDVDCWHNQREKKALRGMSTTLWRGIERI